VRSMPVEHLTLGGVPALVAAPRAGTPARGTVLLYHPLGADKSLHAEDLARLAGAGFTAVGVDAIAHGERRVADGVARFLADPAGALLSLVTATAAEVPAIVDDLVARGWATAGRIGIAGVSLGGFVAYGAAIAERRIAAAACIAASPRWGADPRSPHLRVDAFHPVALLSVTAGADGLVAPGAARSLHEGLAPRYAATPERLRYVELEGERHHMSRAGWSLARDEVERWFARFLGPA
jgi:dienelactone hydrolase